MRNYFFKRQGQAFILIFFQIRMQHATISSGHEHLEDPLKNMEHTRSQMGLPPTEYLWTDLCCKDRDFVSTHIPSLQEPRRQPPAPSTPLPIATIDVRFGTPMIVDNEGVANNEAIEILRLADELEGKLVVGLDAEWDVDYIRGSFNPIATLQIAIDIDK